MINIFKRKKRREPTDPVVITGVSAVYLLSELIKQFEDDKARETFNAERAKEQGNKDRYLQHLWQGVAYGMAARKIEQKLQEVQNG